MEYKVSLLVVFAITSSHENKDSIELNTCICLEAPTQNSVPKPPTKEEMDFFNKRYMLEGADRQYHPKEIHVFQKVYQ